MPRPWYSPLIPVPSTSCQYARFETCRRETVVNVVIEHNAFGESLLPRGLFATGSEFVRNGIAAVATKILRANFDARRSLSALVFGAI